MFNRFGLADDTPAKREHQSSMPQHTVAHYKKNGFKFDADLSEFFTAFDLSQPHYYDLHPKVLVGLHYPLHRMRVQKGKSTKIREDLRGRVYPAHPGDTR